MPQADLCICLSGEYPAAPPDVIITRSSGIGEDGERQILQEMQDNVLAQSFGETCVYQIIYGVMEQLEARNSCVECGICFEQLLPEGCTSPERVAVRTECFHVFHIACLAKWLAVRKVLVRRTGPELPTMSRSRALQMKVNEKKQSLASAEAALHKIEQTLAQKRHELAQCMEECTDVETQSHVTMQYLQQTIKKLQVEHTQRLQTAHRVKAQLTMHEEQLDVALAQEQEKQQIEEDSDHFCPVCRANVPLHTLGTHLQSEYQCALDEERASASSSTEDALQASDHPGGGGQQHGAAMPTANLDTASLPAWLVASIRETQRWQRDTWSRLKANNSS